jgi:hypothetical protein
MYAVAVDDFPSASSTPKSKWERTDGRSTFRGYVKCTKIPRGGDSTQRRPGVVVRYASCTTNRVGTNKKMLGVL